jgi:alkyl hydroperoxide reductase subunit AhpC
MLNEGDIAPEVMLQMGDGSMLALSDLKKPLVLYFYPKDDTSGCTVEAKDFSALKAYRRTRRNSMTSSSPNMSLRFRWRPMPTATSPKGSAPGSRKACTAANIWASNVRPS